jgi:hypothetical protein
LKFNPELQKQHSTPTMIFYILTLIVVLCTSYFLFVANKIDILVSIVNAEFRVTNLTIFPEEHKTNPTPSLQKLVSYILHDHTLMGWGQKVFFYACGFVFYVMLPLSGINLIGFQTDGSLGEFFLSIEDNSFLIANASVHAKITTWAIVSIVYVGGVVVALSVSIRKLRRRFCTLTQRSSNNF